MNLSTLLSLPSTIGGWSAVISVIVLVLDLTLRQRRIEADKIKDSVIQDLQTKTNLQQIAIDESSGKIRDLERDLAKTIGINQTLDSIVKGTDKATTDYRARVESSLKRADESHGMILKQNKILQQISKLLTIHIKKEEEIFAVKWEK